MNRDTNALVRYYTFCIAAVLSFSASTPAVASLIRVDTLAAFNSQIGGSRLVADFDDRQLFFPEFNVVPAPGFSTVNAAPQQFFRPSFSGLALSQSGREGFDIRFNTPVFALGLDTLLNGLGPGFIQVFDQSNSLLGSFTVLHDQFIIGFFGVISTEQLGIVRFTSTRGEVVNTGIDNIRLSLTSVPAPPVIFITALALLMLIARRVKNAWP